ncbi:hypothetical protein ACWD5F_10140 [Streptomyces sp. NPDC002499]
MDVSWTPARAAMSTTREDGPIVFRCVRYAVSERGEQGEDCLSLTVTTPAVDDRARPVLVRPGRPVGGPAVGA